MINWDAPNERYYEHGLDRGVLYPAPGVAVPWNGLTGLTESGNGSSTMYYIDGQIYLADQDPSDFSGSITAYSYPDEFGACIGQPRVSEGLIVDNQKPTRFGMSYRSLVGSGTDGDMFGYQIHLVYNAMAAIGSRARKSINNTPSPLELSFDLVATPVAIPGLRPTAHLVIDTRYMTPDSISQIENILYGLGDVAGALPDPNVLYDMFNFGSDVIITVLDAGISEPLELLFRGDGNVTIEGSSDNIRLINGGTEAVISGVTATDNGDGTVTFTSSEHTIIVTS